MPHPKEDSDFFNIFEEENEGYGKIFCLFDGFGGRNQTQDCALARQVLVPPTSIQSPMEEY